MPRCPGCEMCYLRFLPPPQFNGCEWNFVGGAHSSENYYYFSFIKKCHIFPPQDNPDLAVSIFSFTDFPVKTNSYVFCGSDVGLEDESRDAFLCTTSRI